MNKQFLIIAIIAAIAIYLLGLFTCNGYYKGKYQCPTIKADTVKKFSSDTGGWHLYPGSSGTVDSAGKFVILDSNRNISTVVEGKIKIADIDYTKPIIIDPTTGRVSIYNWPGSNNVLIGKIDSSSHDNSYFNSLPTDSIGMIMQLQKQYSDLLNLFYKSNNYTDTTHLRNGIVKVQSIVQKNTLIAQRVILDSAYQTTITKTSTPITLKEKTQLWAGIDLYGNKHDYLSGAGISAMLKFPHIALTGGAYFDQYNNVNYSAGIKWLIRFKK